MRYPIDRHLDTVILFTEVEFTPAAYEAHARSLRMRIVSEQEFLPFWLMKKTGFAMIWVTPVSTVRVHSVSLLDHKADPKSANKLGVALVQTVDALQAGYEHLFERPGRPRKGHDVLSWPVEY